MSKKPFVIGIGGVARAGKDTFATILINLLKESGRSVDRIALAEPLKADFDEFCRVNFGFSSFTQIPSEKALIRPALVWYGDAQRKRTMGRHWIELADKKINTTTSEVVVVTDVRYDHYERDEVNWLVNECGGLLIHLSQFSWGAPETTKVSLPRTMRVFVPPANDHELLNDPKVQKKAHIRAEWPNVNQYRTPQLTPDELTRCTELTDFVKNIMADAARVADEKIKSHLMATKQST